MTILQRNALFFLLLLLASCGGQFQEEKPFAVQARQFRHYADAKIMANRLEDLGLKPYIKGYQLKGEGHWYGIFLGASSTLEGMIQLKMQYEDEYGLKGLDRANYNQLAGGVFELDKEETYSAKERPLPLPSLLQPMVAQLPYMPNLSPTSVRAFRTFDSLDIYLLRPVREMGIEFPKGLSPTMLEQASLAMVGAVYEDNLLAKKLSLTAILLKTNHALGADPAQMIAESIMGSRSYENDQFQKIASNGSEGFLITLVPRADRMRHYVVLFNKDTRMLVLGESSDNDFPRADWGEVIAAIGDNKHLGYYYHVQEGLKDLPSKENANRLASFQLSFRQDEKGPSASRYRGHRELEAIFCMSKTDYWTLESTQFVHEADAQFLFEKVEPKQRVVADSVTIGGYKGKLRYAKKAISVKKKLQYQMQPTGLEVLAENHLMRFGFPLGGYSAEAMQEKALYLVGKPVAQ